MIATIILLAITVTLFSAIFFFVTSFPPPPAQNVTNFQASLITHSSGGSVIVEGVNITHYGGPSVSNGALVYLVSANNNPGWQFNTPLKMSCGGVSGAWTFGQTWSLNFSSSPCVTTPPPSDLNDAITVTVVSQSTLLYSGTLQSVANANYPPVIVSTWTSPSPVLDGSSFQVYATISGCTSACTVTVNLVSVPGLNLTSAWPMTLQSASGGVWGYTTSSTNTPNQPGVYTGVITATNTTNSQTAVATVSINVWPS